MKKYVIELNNDELTETYFDKETNSVKSLIPRKIDLSDEKSIEEEIQIIANNLKQELLTKQKE